MTKSTNTTNVTENKQEDMSKLLVSLSDDLYYIKTLLEEALTVSSDNITLFYEIPTPVAKGDEGLIIFGYERAHHRAHIVHEQLSQMSENLEACRDAVDGAREARARLDELRASVDKMAVLHD